MKSINTLLAEHHPLVWLTVFALLLLPLPFFLPEYRLEEELSKLGCSYIAGVIAYFCVAHLNERREKKLDIDVWVIYSAIAGMFLAGMF